jgi:hypothetical protein
MRAIGTVKLVQVQRIALKIGEKPNRRYDPAGLQVVDELLLTADGVVGLTADGGRLVDIHNATHPHTRNRGDNGISIGLTAYYAKMRDRFGDHMTDGIAGENIIIETDRTYTLADLGTDVVFENPVTGVRTRLRVVEPAAPCVPFSEFASRHKLEGSDQKAALQFLNDGGRGFLLAAAPSQDKQVVAAGDRVYVNEA